MVDMYYYQKGYVIFSLAIILLISCQTSSEYPYVEREDIEPIEGFDLKLPSNFLNQTKWSVYKESEKLNLIEYGRTKEGDLLIFLLELEAKAYGNPVRIPREGPNGFNAPDAAVQLLTRDSILVFPIASKRFYLYNDQGHQVEAYLGG